MVDKIAKIVYDKNKRRQVLNKNDIKTISEKIIDNNNFMVPPRIEFGNKSSISDTVTGQTNKDSVTFFIPVMESSAESEYKDLDVAIDGGKIDFYNYYFLETIFHEFAHVRQNDIMLKRRNSVESNLFSICHKLSLINGFYAANYRLFADETDAFIRSAISTYSVYRTLPLDMVSEHDSWVYETHTLNTLMPDYEISSKNETVKSPSEILLEKADNYNHSKVNVDVERYRNIVKSKNELTIYKKLLLGLPITYEEACYVNMLKTCVLDGEKVDFVKKLQKKL